MIIYEEETIEATQELPSTIKKPKPYAANIMTDPDRQRISEIFMGELKKNHFDTVENFWTACDPDIDSDFVTSKKLFQALREFETFPRKDVGKLVRDIDRNGNGVITGRQFIDYWPKSSVEAPENNLVDLGKKPKSP
jgi:hypothetical protein